MPIKEYLEQISTDREYIRQLKIRRDNLHINYSGICAIDYSGDKVQSSPQNELEAQGWKLLERIQNIDAIIAEVSIRIDDRLKEIHEVGGIYSQILFMRYSDNKTLEQIADDFQRDYHYVCQLNGEALKKFDELHNKS